MACHSYIHVSCSLLKWKDSGHEGYHGHHQAGSPCASDCSSKDEDIYVRRRSAENGTNFEGDYSPEKDNLGSI